MRPSQPIDIDTVKGAQLASYGNHSSFLFLFIGWCIADMKYELMHCPHNTPGVCHNAQLMNSRLSCLISLRKKEYFVFAKSPDSFLTEIERRLIVPPLQTADWLAATSNQLLDVHLILERHGKSRRQCLYYLALFCRDSVCVCFMPVGKNLSKYMNHH